MTSPGLRWTNVFRQLSSSLGQDSLWLKRVESAPRVHLAILVEPFLSYILDGRKTVESRFSVTRSIPYECVGQGDIVLLKRSSGPVLGVMTVDRARFVELGEDTWPSVRALSSSICADEDFWSAKADKRYATMLYVGSVQPVEPFYVKKADRRPWVVLNKTSQLELRPS